MTAAALSGGRCVREACWPARRPTSPSSLRESIADIDIFDMVIRLITNMVITDIDITDTAITDTVTTDTVTTGIVISDIVITDVIVGRH